MTAPIALSVLFVCLGNICRSPMAEGTFRHHLMTTYTPSPNSRYSLDISRIDSCGTGAYHVGSAPDPRTVSVLKAHGITMYRHKARKLKLSDYQEFDYIFVMDESNFEDVMDERRRALKQSGGKKEKETATAVGIKSSTVLGKAEDGLAHVMLFGAFGGKKADEIVDDPYYGEHDGFEIAYEQVDRFSRNFLEWLEQGEKGLE
jgi:low molecular weight phosphotyrosine protein phosphatase